MTIVRHFHLLLLFAVLSVPAAAVADVFNFTATMDSSQEVPSNSSTATGFATVTYDDSLDELAWNISWSGLTSAETGLHFHQGAPGTNGPVQVNVGNISGLVSPSIGSTTISTAQAAELLAGNWYLNLHTTNNPGGEIRGQVLLSAVPEPLGGIVLGGIVLAGTLRRRRARLA